MNLVPGRDTTRGELVLLAPPGARVPSEMSEMIASPIRHDQILADVQRLRGSLYLHEGALRPNQISQDGRHRSPIDDLAWHIVAVDRFGEVGGCARYMAHENTVSFPMLGVVDSSMAKSREWGAKLRTAVEADIALARSQGIAYVEVGGWAISPQFRNSTHALRIALAAYSLARILGGCVGIGTVTQRHLSASILRRIGGRSPEYQGAQLPDYFDPAYGCQMEILRFESAQPNPRYEVWIHELQQYLLGAQVVCHGSFAREAAFASSLNSLRDVFADSERESSELRNPATISHHSI